MRDIDFAGCLVLLFPLNEDQLLEELRPSGKQIKFNKRCSPFYKWRDTIDMYPIQLRRRYRRCTYFQSLIGCILDYVEMIK